MAKIQTNLLNQSRIKPIAWKRYIDDEKRGPIYIDDEKREPRYIHSTSKQISLKDKIHSGDLIHRNRFSSHSGLQRSKIRNRIDP